MRRQRNQGKRQANVRLGITHCQKCRRLNRRRGSPNKLALPGHLKSAFINTDNRCYPGLRTIKKPVVADNSTEANRGMFNHCFDTKFEVVRQSTAGMNQSARKV